MARLPLLAFLVPVACASPRASVTTSTPAPPPDPYADLLPLGLAIGEARVVALGEPTHAAGNMYAANERTIAFLRERKGFAVLAFERGLWSCETDLDNCLGDWPWGGIAETSYVRGLADHPGFHVTGMDVQATGLQREAPVRHLRDVLASPLASHPDLMARLDVAFHRCPKFKYFVKLTAAERATDRAAFEEARALLETSSAVLDRPLVLRAVANVLSLYDWHAAVKADVSTTIDWNHRTALNNVRDHGMADNVLWLLNDRYPGQKIILWVASMHASRHPGLISETRGSEYAGRVRGVRDDGYDSLRRALSVVRRARDDGVRRQHLERGGLRPRSSRPRSPAVSRRRSCRSVDRTASSTSRRKPQARGRRGSWGSCTRLLRGRRSSTALSCSERSRRRRGSRHRRPPRGLCQWRHRDHSAGISTWSRRWAMTPGARAAALS